MTISSSLRKAGPFLGNGVTSSFPFTFKVFTTSDLQIIKTSVLGTDVVMTLNSDYSVTLNADQNASPGGVITYPLSGTLLQTGEKLTATGVLTALQQTHLTNGGNFFANNIEDQFDYNTILIQQLVEQMSRVALASSSDVGALLSIGTALQRAGTYITFDSNGNISLAQSLPGGTLSRAAIGGYLYPQTAAEANVAVAPSDLAVSSVPYNLARIGLIPNDASKSTANTTALRKLWDPTKIGPVGQFIFPNTTGADVYWFNGVIPIRDGVSIDLNQCTMNLTGAGTSADNNSGLFFAIRDFECKNGAFSINWATGVSTSSGNAICIGARGTDSSYFTVYDSLATNAQGVLTPMGNVKLSKLRIASSITGAGLSSSGAILLVGGVQSIICENIYINGGGTLAFGIVNEFGWATNTTPNSTRQTSHMHDARFTNIDVRNMDNVSSQSGAMVLTGAYGVLIDGLWVNGSSNALLCTPGEAMFYRPWVGVDDTGSKRSITIRNVTAQNFSNSGVTVDGTFKRLANASYLQNAWVINTIYVVNQTVINGGNMYVCMTGGTSAASGGPTGTGTGINDNGVIWNYVTLTANTDLLTMSMDGFALNGNAAATGIYAGAAFADIRNGSTTGCANGLLISEECTRWDITGVTIKNAQFAGVAADFTASQIWTTARLKKGQFRDCHIAGNSQSSAGTFGGISIKNFDGVTVENTRFGFESAYSGQDETTQGQAIFLSTSTNCANLRVRGCRVGGAVGNIGFVNNSTIAAQGNLIENTTFNAGGTNPITTPVSGAWLTDLTSATAPVVASTGTILTKGLKITRVAPAAAVTGIVLEAGVNQGQEITVINEAGPVSSLTFDVVATSHVADGVSSVIAGSVSRKFVWNVSGVSAWYPQK